MKPSPKPDHPWEVKFKSKGSTLKAKFRDRSRKPKRVFAFDALEVKDGESVELKSIDNVFAAHYHCSSTANIKDNLPDGTPSPGDDKDDPEKWRALRIEKNVSRAAKWKERIFFSLEIPKPLEHKSCQAHIQLCLQTIASKSRTDKRGPGMTRVPTNSMIVRITINVS